jgi:similar to spore coat protein
MTHKIIAPHESIEVHEILSFKNVSLTKSLTMQSLVSDPELKTILQQDAAVSQRHVQELSELLKKSGIDYE